MGLTGCYRKFIAHYAQIAAPLTDLLLKEGFAWTSESQQAFGKLKVTLTSAPVLVYPNFNETFVVETDACNVGIRAILTQQST